jgi:type II secretory pathway component PulM
MNDFEHFVQGLGPHASHYSQQQLRQLHAEIKHLARVLLELQTAREQSHRDDCPQDAIDDSEGDRTIEIENK